VAIIRISKANKLGMRNEKGESPKNMKQIQPKKLFKIWLLVSAWDMNGKKLPD
jgi:hypothetical protein